MLNRHVVGMLGFIVSCTVGSTLVFAERAMEGASAPGHARRPGAATPDRRHYSGPVSRVSGPCTTIGGLTRDVVASECLEFACADGTRAYFARFQMRSPQLARARYTELAVAGTETTVAATPTFNGAWVPSGHLSLFLRHDAIVADAGTGYPGESSHGEEWLEGDTICLLVGPSPSHVRALEDARPGGYW